jgi:hypothetical protein
VFHVLEIRRKPGGPSEIVEIEAETFIDAVKKLSADSPGVYLIRPLSGKSPEVKQ